MILHNLELKPDHKNQLNKQVTRDDKTGIVKKKGFRILIVEDELLVAENIKEILQANGYTVVGILSSGEEAIQEFNNLDPHLIVMDIRLAGAMDGIQTAVTIHYTLKDIPILFLTAYPEEFLLLAAVKSTAFDYLTKPYDPAHITDRIENLLAQKK